ncbi:hypothetical protein ACFVT1_36435 [Streptomyces sp. NPDC057963]|uniref:hypothetical protein n=1 Tax=Streptomyces sp. NPDC057963 TaxID=3346290 RepID=UPI0036F19245
MQNTHASEPWPDGVVARYLTVGGATVDLTIRLTLPPSPEPFNGGEPVEEHTPETADEQARAWAQSHAETCRAMPRPEAAR